LERGQRTEGLRREILKQVVEYYTELLQGESDDAEMRVEQGRAYMRYAQITAKLATLPDGLELARQGRTVFARLVDQHPDNGVYRADLAQAHADIGDYLTRTNRFEDAEKEYRAALALFEALPRDAEHENKRASVHHNLGLLHLAAGRPDRAEQSYRTALT